MNNDIEYLLSKDANPIVCDLIGTIFNNIFDEIEYHDDFLYEDIIDDVEELLPSIINTNGHDDLFYMLVWNVGKYPDNYFFENFKNFLFDNFNSEYELKSKLNLIDELLEKRTASPKEWWLSEKFRIMNELKMPPENIFKDQIKYAYKLTPDENPTKAIEQLNTYRDKTEYLGIKQHTTVQLKDLYKKTGDKDSYRKELESLLFDFNYPNFKHYLEYKSLFSEGWENTREDIFKRLAGHEEFLNECYIEEKLYGRILDNIKTEDDLARYSEYLLDDYSDELTEKYSEIIKTKALKSGSRDHYKSIVSLLDDLADIPDGEKEVEKIVEEFREKYARRKAMMDELSVF